MNIENLKAGDMVLVKCKVEAVFVDSGMVMVTTRDCERGFDAYTDEIVGLEDDDHGSKFLNGLMIAAAKGDKCYKSHGDDTKEANMPKFDKSLVKVELIFNKESPMWYESPDNYDTAWLYNNEYVYHMMEYFKLNMKTSQYLYVRTIAERLGIDPFQFKADLGWEKGIYDKFEYKTVADKEKQEIRITFMAAHLV